MTENQMMKMANGPATFKYTSVVQLMNVMAMAERNGVPQVTFENVSADDSKRILAKRDIWYRYFRAWHWSPKKNTLSIVCEVYERCHDCMLAIFGPIMWQVARMEISDEWYCRELKRSSYAKDGRGRLVAARQKDFAAIPPARRVKEEVWPSLVAKVGVKSHPSALQGQDMADWWLRVSDNAVKIVLVILCDLSGNTIELQKWKLIHEFNRDLGRNSPAHTKCTHKLTISRRAGTEGTVEELFDERLYTVEGAPLRLEFQDVFLRHLEPGSMERDIVLDAGDVKKMAKEVWHAIWSHRTHS